MTGSVVSNLRLMRSVSFLLLLLTGSSWSGPIGSPGRHHRASVGRDVRDNPLLEAEDLLSQFLSTLNLTELRPQPKALATREEPPEYMLELYNRFVNDRTSVPSANIVRSFQNEDSSPYSLTARAVRIFPLLFNISMPLHERITIAELRLFTLVQKAQRPYPGLDCKVTIYHVQGGTDWRNEVETKGRRQDKDEVVGMMGLEELVTKQIHAKDNGWVSFDLTHVVSQWRKSGCATHRLEVHVVSLGSAQDSVTHEVTEQSESLVEVDVDRSLERKHNAVMIVFSDDQSRDHKRDKKEINQMIQHDSDLHETVGRSQQAVRGHVNHNAGLTIQDDVEKQSLTQLQSNLINEAHSRIRRHAKNQPCKRSPLFVDFKDIGWDSWVIQPMGYEAYVCNGMCSTPMTSEVSPTKHAMVQTLLSIKSPEKVSRACCVPTKLEPISLLYHENGVITFMHKYEGMVVAECGCR